MSKFKSILKNAVADPITTLVGTCAVIVMVASGQGIEASANAANIAGYVTALITVFSNFRK